MGYTGGVDILDLEKKVTFVGLEGDGLIHKFSTLPLMMSKFNVL
jgi:hypothetical protein